jgi:hypothetical protein
MQSRKVPNELVVLRRVVEKRNPALLIRLDSLPERPLADDERETLRDLVSDEFTQLGLRDDDEPTPYGLFLESIIDWLGHV